VEPRARPHLLACYTKSVRRLIINADDFGMTPGINRAIVEGCEQGIITSATLMATALAFDDAVTRGHERNLHKAQFSIGCHVVLLDGESILPAHRVRSLLHAPSNCPDRQLRVNLTDFARSALAGKLSPEEIEAEAGAQFERIQSAGIALSHFDCHKHAHMFPVVLRPLLRAAKAKGVRAVRNPFGKLFAVPFDRLARNPKLWARFAEMSVVRTFAGRFRREVQKYGLLTPDGSLGILITGSLDPSSFTSMVQSLPEGTWEFVCHPGYNDADLDKVRTRLRASREQELQILTSPEAKSILQRRGIELIGYHDL